MTRHVSFSSETYCPFSGNFFPFAERFVHVEGINSHFRFAGYLRSSGHAKLSS